MANEPVDPSCSNTGIRDAFGNLVAAVSNPQNQERIRQSGSSVISNARNLAARGVNSLTALVNGQSAPSTPPNPATQNTPPENPDAASSSSANAASEENADEAENENAEEAPRRTSGSEPQEEESLITTIMMNCLPSGVKDWAATMTIPLAAQGQNLIKKFGKSPQVSDSPAAYFSCMTGDTITQVPKGVFDYAKKLLKLLGVEDKDSDGDGSGDLAMSISVGFISFLRKHLAGIVPGVKCFNEASSGPSGVSALIDLGANPKTMLSLLRLSPSTESVDPSLLGAFKTILSPKISEMFSGNEIERLSVHSYFGDSMSYGQFVEAYARLGRDMKQAGKWVADESKVTSDIINAADEVLKKYGITDADGSLAIGLATASVYGSEIARTAAPAPSAPASGGSSGPAVRASR